MAGVAEIVPQVKQGHWWEGGAWRSPSILKFSTKRCNSGEKYISSFVNQLLDYHFNCSFLYLILAFRLNTLGFSGSLGSEGSNVELTLHARGSVYPGF